MKKERIFHVAPDLMPGFAEIIGEHELKGEILSVNDDDEIEISVVYEPDEKSEAIIEIMDFLENNEDDGE